jgi:glutamate/tyrosine decarboxylase-like PLP-dependent enzyme
VPVDATTFAADPDAMARAIGDDTILLVGSAPSYAHGVIDPIADLAALARARGLWLHVDACVGGFLLPYWRRLGAPVPPFDFAVEGVTSMSMDLHKYAFAPKGASLVLYRDAALRRHKIYACARWTGYAVVNMAVQSSKTGGPLAGAWAVLHFLGDEGYLEAARRTLDGTRHLVEGIAAVPGLRVLGRPEFCLVAAASDEVSVFEVADEMKARGWYVQPQLRVGASPENLHFSLHPGNVRRLDAMLADLRVSVEAARGRPRGELAAAVQEAFAGLDPESLDEGMFDRLMAFAGLEGAGVPDRMAEVNELLNALPVALRERLLVLFVNRLFTPVRA